MILLNVYYKAKHGMREEFFKAVNELKVPEMSRAEEGNMKYDYYFSDADPDELLLIEHWKDQEAFEIHCGTEHFKSLGAVKEKYLVGTDLNKREC